MNEGWYPATNMEVSTGADKEGRCPPGKHWGSSSGWWICVPDTIENPEPATLPPIIISASEIPAEKIRWVQTILRVANGESVLVVDGLLGPKTREAIKQFQLTFGLISNGLIDEDTTNGLIQHGLNYIARERRITVDGKMDPMTISEIRSFQSTHNSGPVDGIVGPITRAAMVKQLSIMPIVVDTHGGGLEVSPEMTEGWY